MCLQTVAEQGILKADNKKNSFENDIKEIEVTMLNTIKYLEKQAKPENKEKD